MEPLRQVASLAYVETGSAPLVLLVTTRGRGRWTIPKGWTKAGMADAEAAAREAREEGGVEGEIGADPIGSFDYTKRLHLFSWIRCRVAVYPLRVDRQLISWPEKTSRNLLWAPPERAAGLVGEQELAALLLAFTPAAGAQGKEPSARFATER